MSDRAHLGLGQVNQELYKVLRLCKQGQPGFVVF